MHGVMPLSELQSEALEWMRAREAAPDAATACGGILADDVGAGKTRVVAELIKTKGGLSPTLIVVPKSLIYQWIVELHGAGVEQVAVVPMRMSAEGRDLSRVPVILVSISCFGSTDSSPEFLTDHPWGRLVVDEAHLAKNPRTRTHRGLAGIKAQARWLLTATPVQNCRADLLALARLVGVRTNDDVALVRDCFMLRRAVGHPLPPLTVRTVRLDLAGAKEKEVCAEVHADAASGIAAEATAAATGSLSNGAMERVLRCRQAATHLALYFGSLASNCTDPDKALEYAEDAEDARSDPACSTKLTWLLADITAHADERCVVFCDWREEMRLVTEALRERGARCLEFHGGMSIEDRDEALAAFAEASVGLGRRPVALVAQIRCASCGLNLQCASRAYLMRPQDNPAVELQAIGRLHRRGQDRAVTALRLVAAGTIDDSCMARQRQKLGVITETLLDDSIQTRLHGKQNISSEDELTTEAAGLTSAR